MDFFLADVLQASYALKICLIGLAVLSFFVLYRLIVDPYRKVPGPFLARISYVPLFLKEYTGQRTYYLHELHARYGHVVRIAPSELSFNCEEALRDIYAPSTGFYKTDNYAVFDNYGRANVFSSLSNEAHGVRRKRVARVYAKSFVTQPHIEEIIHRNNAILLSNLRDNKVVDMYQTLRSYTYDNTSEFVMGAQHATHMLRDGPYPIFRASKQRRPNFALFFPNAYNLLKKLTYVEAQIADRIWQEFVTARNSKGPESTVLGKLNQSDEADDLETEAEITDTTIAGGDTASVCMTYLVHALASLPQGRQIQDKLYEELKDVPNNCKALEKLPYLDAVVKEGLRLFDPIPGSLPRVNNSNRLVCKIPINKGTWVSTQAYSMHRRPDIFPQPDELLPDRWMIDPSSEQYKIMTNHMIPFAALQNPRVCLGQHFAMVEIKSLFCAIFKEFTVTLVEGELYDMSAFINLLGFEPMAERVAIQCTPRL